MTASQFVIMARGESTNGQAPSLGDRKAIVQRLSAFNTAPEKPVANGDEVLYGPGIRIEMPPDEPITQMLMTITEEEIAWLVIMRLAKELDWAILDPVTGRKLNG